MGEYNVIPSVCVLFRRIDISNNHHSNENNQLFSLGINDVKKDSDGDDIIEVVDDDDDGDDIPQSLSEIINSTKLDIIRGDMKIVSSSLVSNNTTKEEYEEKKPTRRHYKKKNASFWNNKKKSHLSSSDHQKDDKTDNTKKRKIIDMENIKIQRQKTRHKQKQHLHEEKQIRAMVRMVRIDIKIENTLVVDDDNEEEEKSGNSIIPKLAVGITKRIPYEGEFYAFLMIHPLTGKKKDTFIGCSQNPIKTVNLHNNGTVYNKDTRIAAGYWELSTVLGPFLSETECMNCCDDWVTGTRGIKSKKDKGVILKDRYNVTMYSSETKLDIPIKDFLHQFAPPKYEEMYNKITEEHETLKNKQL